MRKNKTLIAAVLALLLTGCFAQGPAPREESTASGPDVSQAEPPEPEVDPAGTVAAITPDKVGSIAAHKAKYPDTVGWLTVPGTDIDTAVVQTDDLTNEYYLNHDLDGNPDKNGTYSIHARCDMETGTREGIPQNTTVFAHNHDEDPDGILFAQLKRFQDPEFARQHPYIFFSATQEDMVWEVFAVFDTVKQFDYLEPYPSWWRMRQVVEAATAASIYDYGIEIGRDDKILTLSTCSFDIPGVGLLPITMTNDYRFVILARLASPEEPLREEADFTRRDDILLPDDFPLWADYICYEGEPYYLSDRFFDTVESIQPIDRSALVKKGTVKRTIHGEELADWNATLLPAGTEIYFDPRYPKTLVADIDGDLLPYTPEIRDMQYLSLQLLWQEDGETVKTLEVDDAVDTVLWPISDVVDDPFLEADEEITPRVDSPRIVLELQFPVYCVHFEYYPGIPASVGKEVLVVRQFDGYYYKEDPALFQKVLDLFAGEAS